MLKQIYHMFFSVLHTLLDLQTLMNCMKLNQTKLYYAAYLFNIDKKQINHLILYHVFFEIQFLQTNFFVALCFNKFSKSKNISNDFTSTLSWGNIFWILKPKSSHSSYVSMAFGVVCSYIEFGACALEIV